MFAFVNVFIPKSIQVLRQNYVEKSTNITFLPFIRKIMPTYK